MKPTADDHHSSRVSFSGSHFYEGSNYDEHNFDEFDDLEFNAEILEDDQEQRLSNIARL